MSDNRYVKDEGIQKEGGLISFDTIIKAGVVYAGAKKIYNSGMLKSAIQKTAKSLSDGSLDKLTKIHEVRAWLSHTSDSTKDSLLRSGAVKRLMSAADKNTLKQIFEDTRKDSQIVMKILKSETDEGTKRLKQLARVNDETKMELFEELAYGNAAIRDMVDKDQKAKKSMQSLIFDNITKRYHQKHIDAQNSLSKNGFRDVTLDDVFDFEITKNGRLKLKSNGKIKSLDPVFGDKNVKDVTYLEAMLNGEVVDFNGRSKSKNGEKLFRYQDIDYKNLILDKNLKITDKGEILDLRRFNADKIHTVRALATEFKVPFLGINPLKMVGFDKFGKVNPKFGYVGEDVVAPALTGMRGNSVNNTIRAAKLAGNKKLADADSGLMIVDGDVYKTVNGVVKKVHYNSKKEVHISYNNQGQSGFGDITQFEYSQLKMMGISNVESASFSNGDNITNKILDLLDIGKQDKMTKVENGTAFNYLDPDNAIGNGISKLINKISKRDIKYYDKAHEMLYKDGSDGKFGTLFITNKATSLKDIIKNPKDEQTMYRFVSQFFADFNTDYENVTSVTSVFHFLTDRLSTTLGNIGLGLSEKNNSGPFNRMIDIISKRALPLFGLYAGWQALNTITEGTDSKGQRTNLNRGIMELYASVDVGFAKVTETLGITNAAKNISQILPGFDFISEMPGLNLIHLDQTASERKKYWEYGKDKVRNGRYWALSSSSAYTGGTIDYWRMNPLQRSKSDARFSDSLFGSRKEYLANIFNPYHYDLKHYYDRPYLQTSPAFENVPVFGELLSGTVGKIVKPTIKMHRDYWNGNKPYMSVEVKRFDINNKIEQERMVSQTVSDVLNNKASTIAKNIFKDNFVTHFFENIIDSANISLRKHLRPSTVLPYEYRKKDLGANDVENAMLFATEPYAKGIFRKALPYNIERNFDTFLDAYYAPKYQQKEFFGRLAASDFTSIQSLGEQVLVTPQSRRQFISGLSGGDFSVLKNTRRDFLNNGSRFPSDIIANNIYQSYQGKNFIPPVVSDLYYSSNLSFQEYKPYDGSQEKSKKPLYKSFRYSGVSTGTKKNNARYATIDNRFDLSNQHFVYRTGSGQLQIVNSGKEIDPLLKVNSQNKSIESFEGATFVTPSGGVIKDDYITYLKELKMMKPNNFEHTVRTGLTDFMNVAGIYGYGGTVLFTGDLMQDTTILETPSYSRSLNKAFWDQDLGGLSGDISEIFRRFVQKRKEYGVTYFNPIRNTMPEWLPGEDGFIDFQHGDPYSKIKNGEERLPGEGYERAHGININDYKITSSKLGYDVNSMIKYFLGRDGITDERSQEIVAKGTRAHLMVEEYFERNHVAIDTEQEIWDKKNNISGIYDVRMVDETSITGEAIVDIKTINDKGFKKVVETSKPKEEHVKQINFYLHNTNKLNNGGVLYINRDDPTQMYMTKFKYSAKLYKETIDNVNKARHEVQKAIESGQISRAERYKPIDKFRILADVAPYSQEYNDMEKYISALKLQGDWKEEFDMIRERVSEQRRRLRTYDYRFKTADVTTKVGVVSQNMGDNMFAIAGVDNPLKFAGINIKTVEDFKREGYSTKEAQEKIEEVEKYIDRQMKGVVKYKVAQDKYHRYNKDTYQTMDAVIYANGKNLNKTLVKKGYATEDTNDFSAPGVHARFNSVERLVGSAWEFFAHQNTAFNNRILRVRSAKEEYEREMTYGISFKSWTKPIEHFIKPAIWMAGREESNDSRIMAAIAIGAMGAIGARNLGKVKLGSLPIQALKHPIVANKRIHASVIGGIGGAAVGGAVGSSLLMAGVVGSMFGGVGSRSTFGRLVGATAGVSTVLAAKAYRVQYEAKHKREWVPEVKRQQANVIDYIDKLKYIRNRRLFEIYAKKAMIEDGIDVKRIINGSKEKANMQKGFSSAMKKIKRKQRKRGYFDINEYRKKGLKIKSKHLNGVKAFMDPIEKDFDTPRDTRLDMYKRLKESIWNAKGNIKKDGLSYILQGDAEEIAYTRKNKKSIKRYRKKKKEEIEKAYKRKRTFLTQSVNKAINAPTNSKELTVTSYNAMKAIEYYNESEKTMYAYDPGDSITDFISALPKRDRKFFNEFLKASKDEREELLKITPRYMTRALQSAYGREVYEKENLTEYFNRHYLPDEDWVGWQEGYDFNVVETKILEKANAPLSEYGKWDDDIIRANAYGPMAIPNINHKTNNINAVQRKLTRLLGDAGYYDIEVDVMSTGRKSSINLDIFEDRAAKVRMALQERMREDEL